MALSFSNGTAQAANWSDVRISVENFTYNFPWYQGSVCRLRVDYLTRAERRDLPSNYDYYAVYIKEMDGNVIARDTGARYGTYGDSARWISDRTIMNMGTSMGPYTVEWHDTDYATRSSRNTTIAEDSIEIPAQLFLDAGGECTQYGHYISNTPPVAEAGEDVYHAVPHLDVFLDGRASYDEDGDELTYSWVQISGPEVELTDADIATPSFSYPPGRADQELVFELTVFDGTDYSETDMVTVYHNGRSNGNAKGRE